MRLFEQGGRVMAAALVMACVACSDTEQNRANDRARETGDSVSTVARDAGDAVSNAARSTGDAVTNAGRAADAAVETMDVKAALLADSRISATEINVDTDHQTKTVTLKGYVPTPAQKTTAEQIATEKAVGYRVRNDLIVRK